MLYLSAKFQEDFQNKLCWTLKVHFLTSLANKYWYSNNCIPYAITWPCPTSSSLLYYCLQQGVWANYSNYKHCCHRQPNLSMHSFLWLTVIQQQIRLSLSTSVLAKYEVGQKEKRPCLFSQKDEISCGYASITSTTSSLESFSDNLATHSLLTTTCINTQ